MIKQLTGFTIRSPKNAIEKELDEMGFVAREVRAKTGDRRLDAKVHSFMGPMMEVVGNVLISTPTYQRVGNKIKQAMLAELISEVRREAVKRVQEVRRWNATISNVASVTRCTNTKYLMEPHQDLSMIVYLMVTSWVVNGYALIAQGKSDPSLAPSRRSSCDRRLWTSHKE